MQMFQRTINSGICLILIRSIIQAEFLEIEQWNLTHRRDLLPKAKMTTLLIIAVQLKAQWSKIFLDSTYIELLQSDYGININAKPI